jgi:hypothetical protein
MSLRLIDERFRKILHKEEQILVSAEISNSFYFTTITLYMFAFILLFVGYEYEIGVIGMVLLLRTFYLHLKEIKDKKFYQCVLTEERIIIQKGHLHREVFPIELSEIRTIYIKPFSERFKNIIDVGTLEVITNSGGRYVISHIKKPYAFHKEIISDVVDALRYEK